MDWIPKRILQGFASTKLLKTMNQTGTTEDALMCARHKKKIKTFTCLEEHYKHGAYAQGTHLMQKADPIAHTVLAYQLKQH